MSVTSRLASMGLVVPEPATAVGSYVPAVRDGDTVYTSGQLPVREGRLFASGLVGSDVSAETAYECARQAALNALSAASTVCDLEDVTRVVKVTGYVASADGFTSQPTVINGASDVLLGAFGDRGRHAREAVGVARLPVDAPVEVSVILSLR
ncbi:MAG: RidA family protein [Actinomycetota bacterium]|jgi:enamine deaminase RidA (YjgF/YER057c/UK114 family)|nr:RidA family protein [Actinomycetota bacterium]